MLGHRRAGGSRPGHQRAELCPGSSPTSAPPPLKLCGPCSHGETLAHAHRRRHTKIVQALGDIREAIQNADAASKASTYNQLELRLTYQPGENLVYAEADLNQPT